MAIALDAGRNQLAENYKNNQQLVQLSLQRSNQQSSQEIESVRRTVRMETAERLASTRQAGRESKAVLEEARAAISRSVENTSNALLKVHKVSVDGRA